jgi:1,4-dihydroxy-2-naphthoate octaprenyltransferase
MVNLKVWLLASRPKTLPASIVPVIVGTAMAYGDGKYHFLSAIICLFCSVMIQIGTNISNDYFDFKKGTDTGERIGPTRVTQAGLIPPSTVKLSFIIVFLVAGLASLYLVYRGGLPVVIIGVLSIVSGILYTAGPKPLGYIGLGEIFVLFFFGPVAVAGTYYVQSLKWGIYSILIGFSVGLISVAILAVNNYRDIEQDKKTGKHTLAVLFGRTFAQYEYIISIVLAALIPAFTSIIIKDHYGVLFSFLIVILAFPCMKTILTKTDGVSLNNALASTGKLLIIFSILFSIGYIL